ncbi:zinc ribbon domain-containing protein [Patescibacteria group bacterium]|nr:zinc ribbon domain-containing protein [Patescibacteria group bacterium]
MQPAGLSCPQCHQTVLESYYFCPNCGKNLKPAPLSITPLKQIGIYALSIFLPPLGLWPGVKYLMGSNKKAKVVGTVAIILTVLSTVISAWLFINWVNGINNSVNKELMRYQGLGY